MKFALPGWLASITHVPAVVKLTTDPEIEHTDVAEGSIVNITGSPEEADAATVYVPPGAAFVGGFEVKVIVCEPLPTANDCCTWGAGLKLPLPAWFASITHVPAPVKVTVEPDMEHTAAAAESIVKLTGRPEDAVAVTLYVGPPTTAPVGAVDVNVIVWLAAPTANDCCTCGAALKFALPAWLPSMTHVPAAVKLTVAPEIEHTELALASMVKVTVNPEDAVAVTV